MTLNVEMNEFPQKEFQEHRAQCVDLFSYSKYK